RINHAALFDQQLADAESSGLIGRAHRLDVLLRTRDHATFISLDGSLSRLVAAIRGGDFGADEGLSKFPPPLRLSDRQLSFGLRSLIAIEDGQGDRKAVTEYSV